VRARGHAEIPTPLRFSNLRGIDLVLDPHARATQIRIMLRERTFRPPYHITRGDLTRTPLPSASQDATISISTIEHGVDVERFLARGSAGPWQGGLLFVTTDYWEDKIDTQAACALGFPWQIFSRERIIAPVKAAQQFELRVVETMMSRPARTSRYPGKAAATRSRRCYLRNANRGGKSPSR
jgi:hypothetical protein